MIKRRFWLLGSLSVVGAALFTPFMAYSTPSGVQVSQAGLFVAVCAAVALPSTWWGLRLTDAVQLPMPFLRAWEEKTELPAVNRAGVVNVLVGSILLTATAVGLQYRYGVLTPMSPLWTRVLSVVFASVTLEVVLHLLGMSLFVRLLRGRVWMAIVGSGVLLGLFHLVGSDRVGSVELLFATMNAMAGVYFGWLFWRFGFEYLVVAHALAHVATLALT